MITMRSIIRGVRNALAAQQRQLVVEQRRAAQNLAERQVREDDAEDRRLAEMAASIMRRQAKLS